ncbi:MAG: translation initiation factor IF-2, partial [Crocinitomicaceae bacterium]|nr:translation initiation factor IF-2 [Crocinitomicaceae bacterium]
MAGKPIRLGKAASELNVGLPTLVDFLDKKGVKIDSNPNTRLEPEHYDLLCQEFAADQNLKEQSKGTNTRREKRESVSIKDKPTEEKVATLDEEDEETDINFEEIKRQILSETKTPVVEKQ